MEGYDYDAAARTVKIEDITSDETNQEILLKIKGKFRIPTFVELYIDPGGTQRSHCYVPGGAHDSGWLGYFIGKNTSLKALYLESNPFELFNGAIETFCEGVNSNRSIQRIEFVNMDLSGGDIFQSLLPFFENNNNLCELVVYDCHFGAGCARKLSWR